MCTKIPIPVFLFLLTIACTHEPSGVEEMDLICFESQVMPIIQTSCASCHSGSEEGFLATSYNSIMESVTPGDPRGSKLYKVITNVNSFEKMMPPDRPLTKLQRSIIEVWILQGANETKCPNDTIIINDTNKICFVQDILPVLLSSCGTTGCHDAATHEEGYILTSYSTIRSKGIVPFNPGNSKLYEVVTQTGEDRMPPSPRSPLTTEQIAALSQWIKDGAQNSDCPSQSCDSTGTMSFSTQINPLIQTNCVGCHNGTLASGGINLSSYNQIALSAQTIRNNTPLLLGVIKRQQGFIAMPPTFSLDACAVTKIEKWINQGANQ
jgi:uncharacterized membrane protein